MSLFPRIRGFGDVEKAKGLMFFAKKQLNILHGLMQFQKLVQSVRRLEFSDGTKIICNINHGISQIDIFCPLSEVSVEVSERERIYIVLSIVYGDPEERLICDVDQGEFLSNEAVFCGDGGHGIITAINGPALYGSYVKCDSETSITGESSNTYGFITSCVERYYDRLYEYFSLFSTNQLVSEENNLHSYNGNSSFTVSPLSNAPCLGYYRVVDWWSKTLNDAILSAFVFYPDPESTSKWAVTLSIKGTVMSWDGRGSYFPSGGYNRKIIVNPLDVTYTNTHIGFDVWMKTTAYGEIEYYAGVVDQVGAKLSVFKANTDTMVMERLFKVDVSVSSEEEYSSIQNLDRHIRLIGYGHSEGVDKIYWAAPGFFKGTTMVTVLNQYNINIKHSLIDATVITGAWNPLDRTAYFVFDADTIYHEKTINENKSTFFDSYSHKGFTLYGTDPCNPFRVSYDGAQVLLYDSKTSETWIGTPGTATTITDVDIKTSTQIEYKTYSIFNNKKNKGSTFQIRDYTERFVVINQFGYCRSQSPHSSWYAGNLVIEKKCEVSGRYDYTFLGAAIRSSGMGFKYKKQKYEGVSHTDLHAPPPTCGVGTVTYHTEADEEESAIDTSFPYDRGWKSILLNGMTPKDHKHTKKEDYVNISNWIIYKDLSSEALYVVDDKGDRVEDIESERAFFKQQYITQKYNN